VIPLFIHKFGGEHIQRADSASVDNQRKVCAGTTAWLSHKLPQLAKRRRGFAKLQLPEQKKEANLLTKHFP